MTGLTTTTTKTPEAVSLTTAAAFPAKVYALLQDAADQGFEDILSWQSTGKSFYIHNGMAFESAILPHYFAGASKFKSFQRQLNCYGFRKVPFGPSKGGYSHKYFSRDSPESLSLITRSHHPSTAKSASKETTKTPSPPLNDPSSLSPFFFDMDPPPQGSDALLGVNSQHHHQQPHLSMTLDDCFFDDIHFEDILGSEDDDLSVHHMDDLFLSIFQEEGENGVNSMPSLVIEDTVTSTKDDDGSNINSEELSFPIKLHMILEEASAQGYSHIVSWVQEGTAFRVYDTEAFVTSVLPLYFNSTKYESFRRQLNLYGFHRISKGPERGIISHPYFQAGAPEQCRIHICRKGGIPPPTTPLTTACCER